MKRLSVLILFVGITINLYSQSSLELKLMFLAIHPFEELRQSPRIYENSIDQKGVVIREPGVMLSYQKYVYLTLLSFQFNQGIYSDAAAKMAGFTSVYFRYKLYHKFKLSTSLAAGPSLIYREDWHDITHYIPNDGYAVNGMWQTKFKLGVELSFNYLISNRSDITLSAHYGHSNDAIAINLGFRYWVNPNVNFKDGCNGCGNKYARGGGFKLWWKRLWN